MDANSFYERRYAARLGRGDGIEGARDAWIIDRATQIVEALAGVTNDGRAVYPSTLMVKPDGSKTVGGQTTVSVFTEFAWWLAENPDLMGPAAIRDLLINPIRTDIILFRRFADGHAEMECELLSDDYFADDRDDWEAA